MIRSRLQVASIAGALAIFGLASCSPFSGDPIPGPDKQAAGTWYGAATGAGAGAVTGFQVGAGTGPGAWVGAAFGGVYGMFSGLGVDLIEEDQLNRTEQENKLREKAWVQEVLAEHYARRLELHPNRDIYPADWFFKDDDVAVKPEAEPLVKEIARMTQERMPWSRFAIAVYSSSSDPKSSYSQFITKRRAEELALRFVESGVEPRRIVAQATTIEGPVLLDPEDSAQRYRQAVEIIPLDR